MKCAFCGKEIKGRDYIHVSTPNAVSMLNPRIIGMLLFDIAYWLPMECTEFNRVAASYHRTSNGDEYASNKDLGTLQPHIIGLQTKG